MEATDLPFGHDVTELHRKTVNDKKALFRVVREIRVQTLS